MEILVILIVIGFCVWLFYEPLSSEEKIKRAKAKIDEEIELELYRKKQRFDNNLR